MIDHGWSFKLNTSILLMCSYIQSLKETFDHRNAEGKLWLTTTIEERFLNGWYAFIQQTLESKVLQGRNLLLIAGHC